MLILQHLYEETGGTSWSNRDGWRVYGPAGDPCNTNFHYSGVGCHCHCQDGIEGVNCRQCRITRLELPQRHVAGTLPPALGLLNKLSTFDFSGNSLSGTIPTEVGLLSKLASFRLGSTRISGTLPTQLGNLGSVAHASYTTAGILSGGLGDWTSPTFPLQSFIVGGNRISGAIPSQLGQLSNLELLDLSGNTGLGTPLSNWRIVGNDTYYTCPGCPLNQTYLVPDDHLTDGGANLTGPTTVLPRWAQFNGTLGESGLPTELGELRALQFAKLDHLNLNGATLPTELGELRSMHSLYLSSSDAGGVLPTQLGMLHELQTLSMPYNNRITGSLVPEIGELVNLRHLNLENMTLSGTVPDFFGRLDALEYWNTFGCNLTGHLPPSVKHVASVRGDMFDFYVQDEQLELMADYHCGRDDPMLWKFQRDHPRLSDGSPWKAPFGTLVVLDYDLWLRGYCNERYDPRGMLVALFGPGDRFPDGMLKPWATPIDHGTSTVSDIFPGTSSAVWPVAYPPPPPSPPPPSVPAPSPPPPLTPPSLWTTTQPLWTTQRRLTDLGEARVGAEGRRLLALERGAVYVPKCGDFEAVRHMEIPEEICSFGDDEAILNEELTEDVRIGRIPPRTLEEAEWASVQQDLEQGLRSESAADSIAPPRDATHAVFLDRTRGIVFTPPPPDEAEDEDDEDTTVPPPAPPMMLGRRPVPPPPPLPVPTQSRELSEQRPYEPLPSGPQQPWTMQQVVDGMPAGSELEARWVQAEARWRLTQVMHQRTQEQHQLSVQQARSAGQPRPPRPKTPETLVCGDYEAMRGLPYPEETCKIGDPEALREELEEHSSRSSAVLEESAALRLFELRDLELAVWEELESARRRGS